MKKCLEIKGELEGYARGELGNKRRAEVKEHLDLCDNCRRELAELSAYFEGASSLARVKAPADFLERLNRRIAGRRSLFFSSAALKLAGSAAVLLLVVAVWQFPGIVGKDVVAERRNGETANRREVKEKGKSYQRSAVAKKQDKTRKVPHVSVDAETKAAAQVVELAFAGSGQAPAEVSAVYDMAGVAAPAAMAEDVAEYKLAKKSVRALSARKKERALAAVSSRAVAETEEQQPLSTREEVSCLVKSLGGVVLPSEEDKQDEQVQYILINLPAANYDRFLAEMKKRGSFQAEPPSLAGGKGDMLEIRLRLLESKVTGD